MSPTLRYAVRHGDEVIGEYRTKAEALTVTRQYIRHWRQRRSPRRTCVEITRGRSWCLRRGSGPYSRATYLYLIDRDEAGSYWGERTRPELDTVSPKVVYRDALGINRQPEPLKHRRRHSPDGFNWGYTGSGPADLALAILTDAFGARVAEGHYLVFEREHVAKWGARWSITRTELRIWLEKQPDRTTRAEQFEALIAERAVRLRELSYASTRKESSR
jgi:hypothetical protein